MKTKDIYKLIFNCGVAIARWDDLSPQEKNQVCIHPRKKIEEYAKGLEGYKIFAVGSYCLFEILHKKHVEDHIKEMLKEVLSIDYEASYMLTSFKKGFFPMLKEMNIDLEINFQPKKEEKNEN